MRYSIRSAGQPGGRRHDIGIVRQAEHRRIMDPPQVQPRRGRRGGRQTAVAPRQHLGRQCRRRLALAHMDQQAGDVAHHVVQEGIGASPRAARNRPRAATRSCVQVAHRRARLALRRAKGAEVMRADQQLPRPRCMRLDLQRPVARRPRAPRASARARPAIQDAVAVGARQRRIARVEMLRHGARPAQRDAGAAGWCWRRAPARARCAARRCRNAPPARAHARRHRCDRRRSRRRDDRRTLASAASSFACTVAQATWDCQPAKPLPSYSTPTANALPWTAHAQPGIESISRWASCFWPAEPSCSTSLQDAARTVRIAHVHVGAREIELGAHLAHRDRLEIASVSIGIATISRGLDALRRAGIRRRPAASGAPTSRSRLKPVSAPAQLRLPVSASESSSSSKSSDAQRARWRRVAIAARPAAAARWAGCHRAASSIMPARGLVEAGDQRRRIRRLEHRCVSASEAQSQQGSSALVRCRACRGRDPGRRSRVRRSGPGAP